ncbi:unnamed protein product [Caenorhabditis angaria]|uniref:HIT-type domain-containing protein n=1 Tax=Caenorhabditis angaria TaxID=860376 RepID=A0A9P1IX74_9PELO|nr:unnamed protein product [Caenorhabditis angaria]
MSVFAPKRTIQQNRASSRISSLEVNKTLDETVRQQRKNKQLDGLEQDNAHDDPHAHIVWNKAAPKFDDELAGASAPKKKKTGENSEKPGRPDAEKARRRRLSRPEFNKQRFKKSFNVHVMEQSKHILESLDPDFRRIDAYTNSTAPPSYKPSRKFCAVCGFLSKYCCTRCGTKYCSLPCRDIHNDTRCMKWLQ